MLMETQLCEALFPAFFFPYSMELAIFVLYRRPPASAASSLIRV
jgi:hypothetical protein